MEDRAGCETPELEALLEAELARHPLGLCESRLLQRLRRRETPGFTRSPDSEGLFDQHFRLFRALYGIRRRWRAQARADLEIHCLGIRVLAYRNPDTRLPEAADPLEAYYLDGSNALDRERAAGMIADFWQALAGRENRAEALAQLGLEEPVSERAIRSRYLRLARETHPDLGGDGAEFRRIARAYALLSA